MNNPGLDGCFLPELRPGATSHPFGGASGRTSGIKNSQMKHGEIPTMWIKEQPKADFTVLYVSESTSLASPSCPIFTFEFNSEELEVSVFSCLLWQLQPHVVVYTDVLSVSMWVWLTNWEWGIFKLAGKFLNFPSLVCSLFFEGRGMFVLVLFQHRARGISSSAVYVDMHRFKGDFFPNEKH